MINNMKTKKTLKKKTKIDKKTKKIPSICIITLTYNRPEYIIRSFDSLYNRSGMKFDHYVFDDNSNTNTTKILKELKKKYKFKLFLNKNQVGIYKRMYKALHDIPLNYDYYVKLDSDIELLTDDFLKHVLDMFDFPEKVGCVTPRIEGLRNAERYDKIIDFYKGHAIKYNIGAVAGCCMIFPNSVFNSFERKTNTELESIDTQWGVDSMLLDHSKKIGIHLAVEDVSVYHIDNTYGQRRQNNKYFMKRNRWNVIDNIEIWYMKVSEYISPMYLERNILEKIKKESHNFEEFILNCTNHIKNNKNQNIKLTFNEIDKDIIYSEEKQPIYLKKMYKISSPANFGKDPNIPHGGFKYFSEIPLWAKNNPKLVIEEENIKSDEKTKENKEIILNIVKK